MSKKLNKTVGQNSVSSYKGERDKDDTSVFSIDKGKGIEPIIATYDWIRKLKQQNRQLKTCRDGLIAKKRAVTLTQKNQSDRDQNFWKRELDKYKFLLKSKRILLKGLEEKFNKINQRGQIDEDNPLARNIRVLENKLDKTMIKYNESVAMKQTYEHLLNRLRQQRINYDNQLIVIQTTLKGKQHDFQQLNLLAHDAAHAKQTAQNELRQFENKKEHVRNIRHKFLKQKKQQISLNRIRVPSARQQTSRMDIQRTIDTPILKPESDSEQQLLFYEEAFKKLVQVSGGNSTEQIIEKFKSQTQTNKSMQDLTEQYKLKFDYLKAQIQNKKQMLESKFVGGNSNIDDRKMVDQMESNAEKIINDCEKVKTKFDKANKLIVNARAGIEHLLSNFDQNIDLSKLSFSQILEKTYQKLIVCYEDLTTHPAYQPKMLENVSLENKKDNSKKISLRRSEMSKDKDSDVQYDQQQMQISIRKSKSRVSGQKKILTSSLGGIAGKVRRSIKKI